MPKAYLVTSGEYSDYQVNEVFLDKKAAERYCAVRNSKLSSRYSDSYGIEEFEVNDGSKIDTSEHVLWYYSAYVPVISYGSRKSELGEIIVYNTYVLILSNEDRQSNTWKITEERRGHIVLGYNISVYLDHEDNDLASKIAQDRWNEFKAELEGVKL